jgi:acyl carrier protein
MFRSNGFNYYHGPIHPDWPDIQTSISKQRQIRDECTDADELYCLGTSMGGYAAMLFGHYLKADIVHAFGAQTVIDLKAVRLADKDVPESHRDLAVLLEQWNGRTRYKMYYNEGYEPDRIAAESMAGIEGVELFPLPGSEGIKVIDKEQLDEQLTEELGIILGKPVSLGDNLEKAGLDSFATMQVIAYLEDSFGIEVPEENLSNANFDNARVIMEWVYPMIRAVSEK